MLDFLILSLRTQITLPWHLLRNITAEGWRHVWKRLPLFLVLWGLFELLSLMHLLGFLCDELFFRRYRQVVVKTPWFVAGIPRSGTTFLHRVLHEDRQFTSLTMWELLLAPSISERYLYSGLGKLLSPAAHLLAGIRKLLLREMDKIHQLGLAEPEEDFLLLLWVGHCYLLAFICPDTDYYWKLAGFSRELHPTTQARVLRYYHTCLQKHLCFHGSNLTLLSKNPTYTGMLPAAIS